MNLWRVVGLAVVVGCGDTSLRHRCFVEEAPDFAEDEVVVGVVVAVVAVLLLLLLLQLERFMGVASLASADG